MPFQSEAQRRLFHAMEADGRVPKGTVKKWERHTPDEKLPEKVGEQPRASVKLELEGHPETVAKMVRLLRAVEHNSQIGASRAYKTSVDGDGHEFLKVKGGPELTKDGLKGLEDARNSETVGVNEGNFYKASGLAIIAALEKVAKANGADPKEVKPKVGPPPKRNRKEWPYQGTIDFRGLKIYIENRRGSSRHWKDENTGESGSTKMQHHYGEVRRTMAPDGDPVDVYVGPDLHSDVVYIVHQMKKPGFKEYDEDKCMLGFRNAKEAKRAYLKHYNSPKFFGSMTTMSFDDFRRLLRRRDVRGKRISEGLIKTGGLYPSVSRQEGH